MLITRCLLLLGLYYQVIHGLLHLHGLGIIHRDIKLSNMLLQANAQNSSGYCTLKLADFGLSAQLT